MLKAIKVGLFAAYIHFKDSDEEITHTIIQEAIKIEDLLELFSNYATRYGFSLPMFYRKYFCDKTLFIM